jgi:PAS domain S-box-containing protein
MGDALTSSGTTVTEDQPAEETSKGTLTSLDADLTRNILEAAPTILYVYDLEKKRSVFQNRRFGELLGHPSAGKNSSDWTTFIHPEDADRFPVHREKLHAIRAGEVLFWEFRMRDASNNWRWFQSRDSLLSSNSSGAPLLIVGSASEITEQKDAEQRKELLADEMRHRARNLVAIVQAIGRMSRPKGQPEVNKYIDTFMGRLLTLLNTGGIVLSSASRTADLAAIAESTLAPFGGETGLSRISIKGPALGLPERIAGGLALAFHELATNAVKYGALSVERGVVSLTWDVFMQGNEALVKIEWMETGGPPVSPPSSDGFGGLVVRQSVSREPGGEVAFDYAPQGLRCRLTFKMPA